MPQKAHAEQQNTCFQQQTSHGVQAPTTLTHSLGCSSIPDHAGLASTAPRCCKGREGEKACLHRCLRQPNQNRERPGMSNIARESKLYVGILQISNFSIPNKMKR